MRRSRSCPVPSILPTWPAFRCFQLPPLSLLLWVPEQGLAVKLRVGFLRVCPIQLSFVCLIFMSTGSCLALSKVPHLWSFHVIWCWRRTWDRCYKMSCCSGELFWSFSMSLLHTVRLTSSADFPSGPNVIYHGKSSRPCFAGSWLDDTICGTLSVYHSSKLFERLNFFDGQSTYCRLCIGADFHQFCFLQINIMMLLGEWCCPVSDYGCVKGEPALKQSRDRWVAPGVTSPLFLPDVVVLLIETIT